MTTLTLPDITPHRQTNHDMYVRRGVFAEWDLGIRSEVQQSYYWDVLRYERFTHVIDIGAHIGFYTTTALVLWPNAQYIAVEPERENFAILAMNTARYSNIQLVPGAVGSQSDVKNGLGRVLKARSNSGGHIVKVHAKGVPIVEEMITDQYVGEQSYYVPMYTLSDLLDLAFAARPVTDDTRVLLKTDCEGGEWALLADPRMVEIDTVVGEYHYPLHEFAGRVDHYHPLPGGFSVKQYDPSMASQGTFLLRRR